MNTHEKEGIVYFNEPYKVNFWEWIDEHIGLDTLIMKNPVKLEKDVIYVIAFAKNKSYNAKLNAINKRSKHTTLIRGIPEEDLSCIE